MNTFLFVAIFVLVTAFAGSIVGGAAGRGLALLYIKWAERNKK